MKNHSLSFSNVKWLMKMTNKSTVSCTIRHDNYILRDHRIHGIRILPGVTFLDMVFRFGRKLFPSPDFELNKIVFYEPLTTSNEFDRMIHVTFAPSRNTWKITIKSQRIKSQVVFDSAWQNHMKCSLEFRDSLSEAKNPLNLPGIIRSATREFDMDRFYLLTQNSGIEHGPFMKTLGRIFIKSGEELMIIHTGDLAEKFRSRFYLHPALLDGATFAGNSLNLPKNHLTQDATDTKLYIPFAIRRFRSCSSLPRQIYVYSRSEPQVQDDSLDKIDGCLPDVRKRDIIIYGETGEILAEFEEFVVKQVRNPALIKNLISMNQPKHSSVEKTLYQESNANYGLVSHDQTHQHADNPEAISTPLEIRLPSDVDHKDFLITAITTELKARVATLLHKQPDEISTETGFYDLGLDSTHLLGFSE